MKKTSTFRICKANEYLKEAEILYIEKIGNLPILANLYHSMMNSLFALFEIEEPGSTLHTDIIERFKNEYVQAGIFDKKFSGALDFAFHVTHECNCEHMKPPGDEDIDTVFTATREFVQAVSGYLDSM